MPETFGPIAFTASSSSFWRRPVMKTYTPSLTKSFAVANPIPSVPPVMTAVLPSSFLAIVFLRCRRAATLQLRCFTLDHLSPSTACLMGAEPLPNIRDGILVERLVKTMQIHSRYAALPVRCPASGRGEMEAAAQCRIRRCPLDREAPTNRRSQAPHFGNRPEERSCTSSLASIPG